MQNSQQPTPSHQKYSNKQEGTFKKWLPAIVLAVVIHGLLLIVFFNSQKKSVPETNSAIDTRLTEPALLTQVETDWLNNYHSQVYAELKDRVDGAALEWLTERTKAI